VTPYSYGIFEDLGCLTLTSYTVPALLFFNLWPVLIGSVAFVYCCTYALLTSPSSPLAHLSTAMVLYHFFKRKNQLAEVMSSHEGMRRSRYIRLMLLASSEMIITVPYSSFLLSTVFKAGLYKFHWSTLRHNYTHVPQYTTVQWQSDPVIRVILEVDVWSLVYCAFIFFAFFGFADEARVHYRRAYSSITRRVGFSKSSGTFTGSTHAYVVQSGFVYWTHISTVCRRAKLVVPWSPWYSQEIGAVPSPFHSPINFPSPLFPSRAI
jgi:pheromone a factor receptor